ncbi:MAG: radical SAM protein [Thermodesulfobacteriota bacterium]|nr:radical SAM protein [Thermodesulfobacteriota bacterium]
MDRPSLVFADAKGNIMEFEPLVMVARSGDYFVPTGQQDVISLPLGSELYVLPDRHPIGMDPDTGEIIVLEKNPFNETEPAYAVAAFLAPAYTHTFLAAWQRTSHATNLPLYAYTAMGWNDGFVVTGMRTDDSVRQDMDTFDMQKARKGVAEWKADLPDNRLVSHLSHCALEYGCPAALNLFQGREEGPLPTSPVCNANCLGCISYQKQTDFPSPQERITFTPTPDEIAEIALRHIHRVDMPVMSFGQGCEGEPLMVGSVIRDAIRLIRKQTDKGTINLNSNASLPGMVAQLADAGLDSLRISMNSARRVTYETYFRPTYEFGALRESILEMKRRGLFVSINLFVFPGLTDAPREAQALKRFIQETDIDMIQWRNLNIDPDYYLDALKQKLPCGTGIKGLIESIPIRQGYYNPFLG